MKRILVIAVIVCVIFLPIIIIERHRPRPPQIHYGRVYFTNITENAFVAIEPPRNNIAETFVLIVSNSSDTPKVLTIGTNDFCITNGQLIEITGWYYGKHEEHQQSMEYRQENP